jgi:hypothetical protein
VGILFGAAKVPETRLKSNRKVKSIVRSLFSILPLIAEAFFVFISVIALPPLYPSGPEAESLTYCSTRESVVFSTLPWCLVHLFG